MKKSECNFKPKRKIESNYNKTIKILLESVFCGNCKYENICEGYCEYFVKIILEDNKRIWRCGLNKEKPIYILNTKKKLSLLKINKNNK